MGRHKTVSEHRTEVKLVIAVSILKHIKRVLSADTNGHFFYKTLHYPKIVAIELGLYQKQGTKGQKQHNKS